MSATPSKIHRSSMSQVSGQTLVYTDELSDHELLKLIADTKTQIRVFRIENEILENTILRRDATLMQGVPAAIDYALKLHGSGTSTARNSGINFDQPSQYRLISTPSRMSTRRQDSIGKATTTTLFGNKVNILERAEMVDIEIEHLQAQLAKAQKQSDQKHALLKAQNEEISIRVTEANTYRETFNRMVINEGWDPIAQRIPAEIWLRYMLEWAKGVDSKIGKLRIRVCTLNTQYAKYKGQIAIKAELHDLLRPVDFEKCKIDNEIIEREIESKKTQLLEAKFITGDANLSVTVHMKAMALQNKYLAKVEREIARKIRLTNEMDKATGIMAEKVEVLSANLKKRQKPRNTYEVPSVMDYVTVKALVTDLKKDIKILKRKKHIQDLQMQSLYGELRKSSSLSND